MALKRKGNGFDYDQNFSWQDLQDFQDNSFQAFWMTALKSNRLQRMHIDDVRQADIAYISWDKFDGLDETHQMAKGYTLPKIFCRLKNSSSSFMKCLGQSVPLVAGSIAFVHRIPSDVTIMHWQGTMLHYFYDQLLRSYSIHQTGYPCRTREITTKF